VKPIKPLADAEFEDQQWRVFDQAGAEGGFQRVQRSGLNGAGHRSMAANTSTRALRRQMERAIKKAAKGRKP
jgi:hypothetical protein